MGLLDVFQQAEAVGQAVEPQAGVACLQGDEAEPEEANQASPALSV